MRKRLTEEQFDAAIQQLDIGQQSKDIAYGVLVEGRKQVEFKEELGLTKGAISQAVMRVWNSYQAIAPEGYRRVSATLPDHRAFIVEKWAREAEEKLKQDKE